ncbi:bifunctional DNA-formamidopyrimidine glycosylase/DNA-(apurinic or apyrimidinic site) lyase [Silvanigrella aquatica]|uniref:Formamidopyrimidine-DNA glycosylase n=1 Tax=Silvanigrella aquatica TaxID=1915309 RepID=A0A1L4D085_9BACT|nr:bifunctional DNA-formamidopyrimidine glycosylase/DNA-(apurinic or apyrimidinic site) lyase [Silvanigrella aquatica]APJ03608.1 DNA-formamidopyrimidine glycosylase [Silvanigrella aquatica]
MPELPEVQNFVNALNKSYAGLKIKEIQFHRENLRYPFQKKELFKIFSQGNFFQRCYREGKQMVLETSQGSVHVSLGMSGSFKPILSKSLEKHQHVSLYFENGEGLAYVDPRRFGFWIIKQEIDSETSSCDPLNKNELEILFLSEEVMQKRVTVKDLLMDQKIIGGIGNIYAVEALFHAKISPLKLCYEVSLQKWKDLAQVIPQILEQAIHLGGSSISTYRSLNGNKGSFQDVHQVYGRESQACLKNDCKGTIKRIVQKGRSTWFCSLCQKN